MKKYSLILSFVFLFSISSPAQKTEPTGKQITPYNVPINGLDQFGAQRPKGSPYIQPMFAQAKLENIQTKANMRYNAYSDLFEFIGSQNDTLILDKIDDFSTITFLGSNKKYKLVTYSNNLEKAHKGYLIELYHKGNYTLYKREWISFYPGKKAKTSMETEMPAKFNKEIDAFYLKDTNGNISGFPESKKQLVKLFPDKKGDIDSFVKENKIDFDADTDRIKIIDFLAQ
jgi:hypothetical protein